MREIKFRAWDKVDKKVRKVMSLDFYNTRQSEVTLASDGDVYFRYFEQVELMQSTGLFDKNGVEIFEGDIVNIHWFYFDGGGESEVQLHRKEILNYKGVLCFEWQYDYCPLALGNWHEESFEVVGNIYENPELLEVEE